MARADEERGVGGVKLDVETVVAVGMVAIMVLGVVIMAGVARVVWGW